MSKYKAYGKSRGNSRAGLQFDKLLKACNNSKKPPTAMAAGALGRFGVAQFTSTRGCLDSTGEDEQQQEKPSRFSSLNKRPRLEPSFHPGIDPCFPGAQYPLNNSVSGPGGGGGGPPQLQPAQQTVLKPRKFFKSRGPMEVEVDLARPNRPDITSYMTPHTHSHHPPILSSINLNSTSSPSHASLPPTLLPPTSYKSPVKGSKSQSSHNHHHHKDTPSSPTFTSPPIKLKIIKDKVTSKFVSVAEDQDEPPPSGRGKGTRQSKGEKKAKKEAKLSKKAAEVGGDTLPVTKPGRGRPPKNRGLAGATTTPQQPPKVRQKMVADRSPPPKASVPVPPPSSKRSSSGRVTRSSTRYQDDPAEEEVDGQNQNLEPSPTLTQQYHQQNRDNGNSYYSQQQSSTSAAHNSSSEETLKKLEEDVEFQKLSQMLSSMEDEQPSTSSISGSVPQNSHHHGHQHQNQPDLNSSFGSDYSSDLSTSTPAAHTASGSNYFQPPAPATAASSNNKDKDQAAAAGDIRSILEDDWNESFDEESPRKAGYSPPKVSRFDPSAFMPEEEVEKQYHHHKRHEERKRSQEEYSAQEIQRPIPVYPGSNNNQGGGGGGGGNGNNPPTFNINSSPYAMKNLLSDFNNAETGGTAATPEDKSQSLESDLSQPSAPPNTDYSESSLLDSQQTEPSQGSQQSTHSNSNSNSNSSSQSQPVAASVVAAAVAPKKASIFKSRTTVKSDKPSKAVYKHTFGQVDKKEGEGDKNPAHHPPGTTLFDDFDEYGDEEREEGGPDLQLRKQSQNSGSGGDGSGDQPDGEDASGGKVLCKKGVKKLFTVVRNVKAGHELQESGEFHEFDGDVMYILEDLKDKNPYNSRCLSAITLAGRCMDQAFRMHLRAHGTVAEFCKELHDAPTHPVLSLLAATVLFVLSQDRLNMDLDTESLKLILALTNADSACAGNEHEFTATENIENIKNRQRVMQLCSEMQARGHAKHLNLEKITASELALETLLYLTSKRAGEWVKHELRTLGGIDSIVEEVETSFNFVAVQINTGAWDEVVSERLRKIDRCLEVLGRVTFNHEDNQRYLMQVSTREVEGEGSPVKCTSASPTVFLEMFRFCREFLIKNDVRINSVQVGIIREILFLLLRLLVNLSHDYRSIVLGSEIMMEIEGFLELALHSIFQMTKHFPDEKVFDLLMHSLCLLLNLVETSKKNRSRILQTTIRTSASGVFNVGVGSPDQNESDDSGVEDEIPLLDALIQMFLQRERSAKTEEQHTDNILTTGEKDGDKGKNSQGSSSGGGSGNSQKDSQDDQGTSVQDTIDMLIQTAGKHMENSLIAAYISLLIAFLVMDDLPYVEKLRDAMPGRALLPLMAVLKKLFNFMSITSSASGSNRGLKATAIALKFYAKVDKESAEELKKIIPE